MDNSELLKRLSDPEFVKQICPGKFLIWPYWKKAYKKIEEAQDKGVANAIELRRDTNDGFEYKVIAYSTNGAIDKAILAELREKVNKCELGSIRFESHGTNGFFPYLDENGAIVRNEVDVKGIAHDYEDYHLIVVAESMDENNPKTFNFSQVIYVKNNKEMWHWALKDSLL